MTNYTFTSGTNILRSDGASIPPDPMNMDYVVYLAWVAAGNSPTPYAPPPSPPLTATPFQFRAGLTAAGIRTQVENMVTNSTNQTLKDAYQYSSLFVENDPLMMTMACSLNLTSAQVHSMFVSMQSMAI